jgi:molybdenum cofactor cytidylyltransferase
MNTNPTLDTFPLHLGALLLAAGSGSRMGHRPKCLLERNGEPLIARLLRAVRAAGVARPVVVLGHHAPRIATALHGLNTATIINPTPDAGLVSSLRMGLLALPDELEAVMVLLSDQPLITHQDLLDLMIAYQSRPADTEWVQPNVKGLPGNPVIFSKRVRAQLLEGPPEKGGKHWQAQNPRAVHAWHSDNVHYRTDVDSPEDIEQLGLHTGIWLRWPNDLSQPMACNPIGPS